MLGRLSEHPSTLIVGSDPAEWWRGHEARDSFFGRTIHYAARVAGEALGGEVLVSSIVHDLVSGSGIDFEESREVELKGLEGLHRLFALDLSPSGDAESSALS